MKRYFTGFLPLYKVAVKQNAHQIAPWIVIISLLCITSYIGYAWVFPDDAGRHALAATIGSNPAFSLIFGTAHNLLTADGFNAWRSLQLGSFFAGLMAIFIVVRETRAKEDSGQAEMVGSSVVGHYTQLAVAVVLAWMASLLLGAVAATATVLSGGDITSSVMLGAGFAASGIMFASIAAITCQLGSYASTASSMAVTFLGACFLVRGYADTASDADWALWFTPMGWIGKIEPAGANAAWPLYLCAAFAAVAVIIANILLARRDFGQGVLPGRPGRARAKLASNIPGLTFRLQRGSIISWTIAFMLISTVFAFLLSSVSDVFSKDVAIAKLLAAGGGTHAQLVFEFATMQLKLLGIIAAVYGVQLMMRFYGEEMQNRVEPLLGGAVSRPKLYASYVATALTGPAITVALGGCVIAFVTHLLDVDISQANVIKQAVTEVVGVWVLIGFSIALIGARPHARLAAWMGIVVTFALTLFGSMFKLWDWIQGISPLYHVPDVSGTDPNWSGLLWLSLVVVFFLAVGFVGLRRRDIARV